MECITAESGTLLAVIYLKGVKVTPFVPMIWHLECKKKNRGCMVFGKSVYLPTNR